MLWRDGGITSRHCHRPREVDVAGTCGGRLWAGRPLTRQVGEYDAAIPAAIADLEVDLPTNVLANADEASQAA